MPADLNYPLRKVKIMQVREDWTKAYGGRACWKAGQDQCLSYGGPPIPLVRAQMLGGKPEAKLWTMASTTPVAATTAMPAEATPPAPDKVPTPAP